MNKDLVQISSSLFQYNKPKQEFTAEASELGIPVGTSFNSFEMRSAVTGAVVRFYHVHTQTDKEGDVICDHYLSEWLPSIDGHIKTIIFND